jgi:hypothetical protein
MTDMTPEQFAASLVPTDQDFANVGGWLVSQTAPKLTDLLKLYEGSIASGRLFQEHVAMGEALVRCMRLREDPAALDALRVDIMAYANGLGGDAA